METEIPQWGGREKKFSFGAYPEVSLKEARKQRDEARKIAAEGIDPAEKRKRDRHAAKVNAANSFQAVARAYIDKRGREGGSPSTLSKLSRLGAALCGANRRLADNTECATLRCRRRRPQAGGLQHFSQARSACGLREARSQRLSRRHTMRTTISQPAVTTQKITRASGPNPSKTRRVAAAA